MADTSDTPTLDIPTLDTLGTHTLDEERQATEAPEANADHKLTGFRFPVFFNEKLSSFFQKAELGPAYQYNRSHKTREDGKPTLDDFIELSPEASLMDHLPFFQESGGVLTFLSLMSLFSHYLSYNNLANPGKSGFFKADSLIRECFTETFAAAGKDLDAFRVADLASMARRLTTKVAVAIRSKFTTSKDAPWIGVEDEEALLADQQIITDTRLYHRIKTAPERAARRKAWKEAREARETAKQAATASTAISV